jgi:hypothetical protein
MNSGINIHGMFAIRKKRGWKDILLAMELYRLWSNFAMQPGRPYRWDGHGKYH